MMIIVEGVDGTGKTTLCRELEGRLGFPLYKAEVTPQDESITVSASQAADVASIRMATVTKCDVILDRSFMSEWVYGTCYGRDVDTFVIEKLDSWCADAGALGIYLRPNAPWEAMHRADDHVKSEDEYRRLMDLYDDYVARSKMTWLKLDSNMEMNIIVQQVMLHITRTRPSKEHVYMCMARAAASRSTCLSARTGAVLLSSAGHVISTGYNGAPAGIAHQCECPRLIMRTKSGEGLDMCNDVHAEENCIVQAAKTGADTTGSTVFSTRSPCHRCMRMLINAGVVAVVYGRKYNDERAFELAKEAGVTMAEAA